MNWTSPRLTKSEKKKYRKQWNAKEKNKLLQIIECDNKTFQFMIINQDEPQNLFIGTTNSFEEAKENIMRKVN